MRVHVTVTSDGRAYEGTIELTKVSSKAIATVKKKKQKSTTITGATGAIKTLYEQGFFKGEKNIGQIMKKLETLGINFDIRLVSMALYRATYLTKKGKRLSYTYVQKHPPS